MSNNVVYNSRLTRTAKRQQPDVHSWRRSDVPLNVLLVDFIAKRCLTRTVELHRRPALKLPQKPERG